MDVSYNATQCESDPSGFLGSHLASYPDTRKVMTTQQGPLTIVVMGGTGVGKSSVLSFLDRPDNPTTFKLGGQTTSVTQEVSTFECTHESSLWLNNDLIRQYKLKLIDSPGLNDAAERGVDLQHVSNFVSAIKSEKLDGLLYISKLGRFDVQDHQTLKYVCSELFTNVPDGFIKIVLTHLDKQDFKDFKRSPELYERKMLELRNHFEGLIGHRAFKVYLVYTGKRDGIPNDKISQYLNYFRNNTDLTPGCICKDEWEVENLDFHTLYFRDMLIHDISQDASHFNWHKTRIVTPPSIRPLKSEALTNLYKRKAELTGEQGTPAFRLTEEINGLNRQVVSLADAIAPLKNERKYTTHYEERSRLTISSHKNVKVRVSVPEGIQTAPCGMTIPMVP